MSIVSTFSSKKSFIMSLQAYIRIHNPRTMNKSIIILFLYLLPGFSPAQNKELTVKDAVLKQRTTLGPAKPVQLQWIKDSQEYSQVKDNRLEKTNAADGKTTVITGLDKLNSFLKSQKADTLAKFPVIEWVSSGEFRFNSGNKSYKYLVSTGQFSLIQKTGKPEGAEPEEIFSDNRFAFILDNNIVIHNNGKQLTVTNDGTQDIVYGRSVHREEFGINKGLFWSAEGNYLAFYRMDQSMVTPYPVVNFDAKPAKEKIIRYPFAGESSHHVTVGIYDVSTGKTLYLQTGLPADQYLTNITFTPDEKSILIAVVNRDQNHMKLCRYEVATGKQSGILFEEKDAKYVEPLHTAEFLQKDKNKFIWQSRRDGFNHLYLYDLNGKLIKQLTKGNWEVVTFHGSDSNDEFAYFTSTVNGAVNRDYGKVNLSSAKITHLTSGNGTHKVIPSPNYNYFIDQFSNINVPGETKVYSNNGKHQHDVLISKNPLADYKLGTTRLFTLKSSLNDDLWCRMILPAGFDSTIKYPVIVYVYGGPHAQLVTNSWLGGGDMWFQYMAANGYIVFTLDNHGSSNRGRDFEQAIFRKIGIQETDDQMKGVEYLKSLPYVDINRMGIHGWSYGGHITTRIMSKYPDLFKCAVAGGPVTDWNYYEVMYTERYMDTPESNPEGYNEGNLLNYIDSIRGKLMMIHGTSDDVVVWQHSIRYLKSSVSKGVQVDYMVYPGHLHNVTGPDRAHLMQKVTDYFNLYLGTNGNGPVSD